jgi:hypothetical protein
MRLAFVRRAGADPVDVLRDGDSNFWNFARYSGDYGQVSLSLPFFRDQGVNAGQYVEVEGGDLVKRGPKNLAELWNALRRETVERAMNGLLQVVQSEPAAAKLRLIRENGSGLSLFTGRLGYDEWTPWTPPAPDGSTPAPRPAQLAARPAPGAAATVTKTPAPPAPAAAGRKGYTVVPVAESALMMLGLGEMKPEERYALLWGSMVKYGQKNTRGIVIDLTGVKTDEATTFLSMLKEAPAAGASAKTASAGVR